MPAPKIWADLTRPMSSVLLVAAAVSLFASCSSAMSERSKLDPILQERLDDGIEHADLGVDDTQADDGEPKPLDPIMIEVIIALEGPPTRQDIDALLERGLTVRSTIGEILTGAIALDDVEALADYDAVVKIESSTILGPDTSAVDEDDEDDAAPESFDVTDFTE